MDGTTVLIILVIVAVVFYMIGSSSSDDAEPSSRDEVGDRAHSANRFQDRDRDIDQGGMDSDGGSGD